jgi:hypothetical protein
MSIDAIERWRQSRKQFGLEGDMAANGYVDRRLNHVEFVHRPGERELALALFHLLGFETQILPPGGEIIIGIIDPATFKNVNNDNVVAGREVRPEQWAFDQALAEALQQEPLASAYAGQRELLTRKPQWGMHFGINFSSFQNWTATVERISHIEQHAPILKERVKLRKVFRPDDAEPASVIHQAFFWTDVIASGSLALGQNIELSTVVSPDAIN